MRGLLLATLSALLLSPAPRAGAQDIPPDVRDRCIRSLVRIEVDSPAGTMSGSGTVLDARGYVLTNFHVVGNTTHSTGVPGSLHATRVRLAIVASEHDRVVDEYVGEVVRGNVQLDLALVRIVGRVDEAPLAPLALTTMSVATDLATLGTRVWALGFPAGVRTINVTAGQVTGFQENAVGEPAWLRTDSEFNPGNSGGALVDQRCQLVGVPTALSRSVEPIELARPSTRIPTAWLAALASGEALTSAPVEGMPTLSALTELVDTHGGDSSTESGEVRYFRLPSERPGVVSVEPRLDLATIGRGGRIGRRATGEVLVMASDPGSTLVAVVVPRGDDGAAPTVRIRYEPLSIDAVGATATPIRGTVRRDGDETCAANVIVLPLDVDAAALLGRRRSGEISDADVRGAASALARVEANGTFEVGATVGPFALAIVGPSGIEAIAPVTVGEGGLDVGEIHVTTPCP